jgi:two-component system chemotaxis response regulator CheB
MALQTLLKELPAKFPVPVVVAIHMPESFTAAYADRLNALCQVKVKEAKSGDSALPGEVLIAPGGHQLVFDRKGGALVVQVKEDSGQIYRPSVDVLFGSAARVLGNQVLAVVLTGMGADGAKGARLLKEGGSSLWSQDEASCVVYGMPQAVENAGLSDRVLPLKDMGTALRDFFT